MTEREKKLEAVLEAARGVVQQNRALELAIYALDRAKSYNEQCAEDLEVAKKAEGIT